MKPIVIAVGAAVGLGLLAVMASGDDAEVSTKDPTFAEVAALPPNMNQGVYISAVNSFFKTVGQGQSQVNPNVSWGVPQWVQDLATKQVATWGARAAPLQKLVETKESPAYVELYRGPWVPVFLFENGSWRWTTRNRYGMHAPGTSTNLWGAALTAAGYVLPMVPGFGTAANAALQAAIALGQGKSLDEAALAAVRGTLPAWGQVAFDLGVGVVLYKKPIDEAALDATLNQLEQEYPGAKQYYAQAKGLAKDLGY